MLGCRDLRVGSQLCPFTEGDAVAQKGKWLAEVMALVARVGSQGLPLLQLAPHSPSRVPSQAAGEGASHGLWDLGLTWRGLSVSWRQLWRLRPR